MFFIITLKHIIHTYVSDLKYQNLYIFILSIYFNYFCRMNILIENQILSPIPVFQLYNRSDTVYIEKYDNYVKRTYRNRFIVLSQNGPLSISIPLKKGKNNNMPFSKVQISYDKNWISPIKNTLKSCYGSAPFFDFYFEGIISIFNKKHKYIYDLNNELREYILKVLELEINFSFTKSFNKETKNPIDYRDYYSPKKEMNKSEQPIKYPQVFEDNIGFHPNLSIVDILFNMGKQTSLLL